MLESIRERLEAVNKLGTCSIQTPKCICCNSDERVSPNIARKNPNLGWKELAIMEAWHCYKCNVDFDE